MKRIRFIIILMLICIVFVSGCDLQLFNSQTGKKLTRGTIKDNVYTSEYAGLSFSPPDGWEYASDEEIAEIMGLTADMLADTEVKLDKESLKQRTIYDVMAQNMETGSNIVIMYDNLALTVGGTRITEEQYFDITKEQLDTARLYDCVYRDITEETLCGNKYKLLRVEIPDYGACQYFYARKINKYMLSVIITVYEGDNISSILNCFS